MLIGGLLTRRGTKKANRDAVSLRLTEKYLGEVAATRCVVLPSGFKTRPG